MMDPSSQLGSLGFSECSPDARGSIIDNIFSYSSQYIVDSKDKATLYQSLIRECIRRLGDDVSLPLHQMTPSHGLPEGGDEESRSKRRRVSTAAPLPTPGASENELSPSTSISSVSRTLTFDVISPDVVVSHIFRYLLGSFHDCDVRECCIPPRRRGSRVLLRHRQPSRTKFAFSLSDEPLLRRYPQYLASIYSLPENHSNVTSLWGYFCRDVFRHPWFLFECLQPGSRVLIRRPPSNLAPRLDLCVPRVVISTKMLFLIDLSRLRYGRESPGFMDVDRTLDQTPRISLIPPSTPLVHLDALVGFDCAWLDVAARIGVRRLDIGSRDERLIGKWDAREKEIIENEWKGEELRCCWPIELTQNLCSRLRKLDLVELMPTKESPSCRPFVHLTSELTHLTVNSVHTPLDSLYRSTDRESFRVLNVPNLVSLSLMDVSASNWVRIFPQSFNKLRRLELFDVEGPFLRLFELNVFPVLRSLTLSFILEAFPEYPCDCSNWRIEAPMLEYLDLAEVGAQIPNFFLRQRRDTLRVLKLRAIDCNHEDASSPCPVSDWILSSLTTLQLMFCRLVVEEGKDLLEEMPNSLETLKWIASPSSSSDVSISFPILEVFLGTEADLSWMENITSLTLAACPSRYLERLNVESLISGSPKSIVLSFDHLNHPGPSFPQLASQILTLRCPLFDFFRDKLTKDCQRLFSGVIATSSKNTSPTFISNLDSNVSALQITGYESALTSGGIAIYHDQGRILSVRNLGKGLGNREGNLVGVLKANPALRKGALFNLRFLSELWCSLDEG